MTIDTEAADAAVYDENIAQWNVEEWQARAERAESTAANLADYVVKWQESAREYLARAEAAEMEARTWKLRVDEAAVMVGNLEAEVERLNAALRSIRDFADKSPLVTLDWK